MNKLPAKELKACPAPGHYRWKYGEGINYHCGLATVYRKRGTWFCDTLCPPSELDSVSDEIEFYGPLKTKEKQDV